MRGEPSDWELITPGRGGDQDLCMSHVGRRLRDTVMDASVKYSEGQVIEHSK